MRTVFGPYVPFSKSIWIVMSARGWIAHTVPDLLHMPQSETVAVSIHLPQHAQDRTRAVWVIRGRWDSLRIYSEHGIKERTAENDMVHFCLSSRAAKTTCAARALQADYAAPLQPL